MVVNKGSSNAEFKRIPGAQLLLCVTSQEKYIDFFGNGVLMATDENILTMHVFMRSHL